ncbi:MAG: hypothetical protein GX062_06645 [Firmicutes bacterium]|nr:hypothetical protein [Bacillota bacterium]
MSVCLRGSAALPLTVRCLDGFQVQCGSNPISIKRWGRKKVSLLFQYLLVARYPVVGANLLEEFWPHLTIKAARHNLAVTLYNLRRVLEPSLQSGEKSNYILYQGDLLQLNWDAIAYYDVDELLTRRREGLRLLDKGMIEEAVSEFESALDIYKLDFLADCVEQPWIADERSRLHNAYLDILEHLSRGLLMLHRYREASQYADCLVRFNPSCVEGHRVLMEAQMALGHRSRALIQYQLCCEILEREWGIGPSPKTRELYLRIANGEDR